MQAMGTGEGMEGGIERQSAGELIAGPCSPGKPARQIKVQRGNVVLLTSARAAQPIRDPNHP